MCVCVLFFIWYAYLAVFANRIYTQSHNDKTKWIPWLRSWFHQFQVQMLSVSWAHVTAWHNNNLYRKVKWRKTKRTRTKKKHGVEVNEIKPNRTAQYSTESNGCINWHYTSNVNVNAKANTSTNTHPNTESKRILHKLLG